MAYDAAPTSTDVRVAPTGLTPREDTEVASHPLTFWVKIPEGGEIEITGEVNDSGIKMSGVFLLSLIAGAETFTATFFRTEDHDGIQVNGLRLCDPHHTFIEIDQAERVALADPRRESWKWVSMDDVDERTREKFFEQLAQMGLNFDWAEPLPDATEDADEYDEPAAANDGKPDQRGDDRMSDGTRPASGPGADEETHAGQQPPRQNGESPPKRQTVVKMATLMVHQGTTSFEGTFFVHERKLVLAQTKDPEGQVVIDVELVHDEDGVRINEVRCGQHGKYGEHMGIPLRFEPKHGAELERLEQGLLNQFEMMWTPPYTADDVPPPRRPPPPAPPREDSEPRTDMFSSPTAAQRREAWGGPRPAESLVAELEDTRQLRLDQPEDEDTDGRGLPAYREDEMEERRHRADSAEDLGLPPDALEDGFTTSEKLSNLLNEWAWLLIALPVVFGVYKIVGQWPAGILALLVGWFFWWVPSKGYQKGARRLMDARNREDKREGHEKLRLSNRWSRRRAMATPVILAMAGLMVLFLAAGGLYDSPTIHGVIGYVGQKVGLVDAPKVEGIVAAPAETKPDADAAKKAPNAKATPPKPAAKPAPAAGNAVVVQVPAKPAPAPKPAAKPALSKKQIASAVAAACANEPNAKATLACEERVTKAMGGAK